MPKKQITLLILSAVRNRPFILWFGVRVFSTAGTLVTTYLFASVVRALENKKGIEEILIILGILLGVQIIENFLRLLSKTRIEYYSSRLVITLHQVLLGASSNGKPPRKELVQAVINLCQSLDKFLLYLKETGISGVVHFFTVPIILLFIDIRVFALEMILIFIYLGTTFIMTRKYEKIYEKYYESTEGYYAQLFNDGNATASAGKVLINMKFLQNFVFFMWGSLQNIVAVFQFLVPLVIVVDIIGGTKQISDLVLVVGYTKESQGFLNNFTSAYEKFMEVDAGIERLEEDSREIKS